MLKMPLSRYIAAQQSTTRTIHRKDPLCNMLYDNGRAMPARQQSSEAQKRQETTANESQERCKLDKNGCVLPLNSPCNRKDDLQGRFGHTNLNAPLHCVLVSSFAPRYRNRRMVLGANATLSRSPKHSSVPLAMWALLRTHGSRLAGAESFVFFSGYQVKFGVFIAFCALLPLRNRDAGPKPDEL